MHTNSLGVNKPNIQSASESAKQEQSVSTVPQPAFSLTEWAVLQKEVNGVEDVPYRVDAEGPESWVLER